MTKFSLMIVESGFDESRRWTLKYGDSLAGRDFIAQGLMGNSDEQDFREKLKEFLRNLEVLGFSNDYEEGSNKFELTLID